MWQLSTKDGDMFHYCDVNAFVNIIQRKKLWLSATSVLNDYQEINFVRQAVFDALNKKLTKENKEILDRFHLLFIMNSPQSYICCFSSEDDLLSQWRSYANDGRGVSIGFNREGMPFKNRRPQLGAIKSEYIGVGEVSYKKKDELDQDISHVIDLVISYSSVPEPEQSEKLLQAVSYLHMESYYTKNNYFSEEKEIRIIHLPLNMTNPDGIHMNGGSISELNFRVSGNKITSYYEFDFSKLESPITEVIFGPKCELNEGQVRFLLDSKGFGNVKLRRSGASYQ